MVLLKFPTDIKSDFDGYNYFVYIIDLVKKIKNEEVVFDFGNVFFLKQIWLRFLAYV